MTAQESKARAVEVGVRIVGEWSGAREVKEGLEVGVRIVGEWGGGEGSV